MSVKIQINSREALERLIGGDSELEVELRNSVVQDFSNRHLKSIATVMVGRIESAAQQAVKEVAEKQIGFLNYDIGRTYFKLKPEVKTAIENEVANLIQEETRKVAEAFDAEGIIKKMVEDRLNAVFKEQVANEVRKQLTEISNVVLKG
jgi:F420-0:gamma-glutamyl ligase-like protein